MSAQQSTLDKWVHSRGTKRAHNRVVDGSYEELTQTTDDAYDATNVPSNKSVTGASSSHIEWDAHIDDTPSLHKERTISNIVDTWDADHVKLPCSRFNVYTRRHSDERHSKWDLICSALGEPITSSYDLEEVVLIYNAGYKRAWDFGALHEFFQEHCDEHVRVAFFGKTIPAMIRLAKELPQYHASATHVETQSNMPIPLLLKGRECSFSLTQRQVACLLCHAFFCTFPRRNSRHGEYGSFPSINFSDLYRRRGAEMAPKQIAKFHCVVNYFNCVTERYSESMSAPNADVGGRLVFSRRVLHPKDEPSWGTHNAYIGDVKVSVDGTIEDTPHALQVDFANKMIGGGVLGRGAVQEEIRFMIDTELIITRLFVEKIGDNEVVLVRGSERYAKYSGYASTFTYEGRAVDPVPMSHDRVRETEIIVIDALYFGHGHDLLTQYNPQLLQRELNKAYLGFQVRKGQQPLPVATGNWGCGAFGGDLYIKAAIQIMAAALAGRDCVYYTFGDISFACSLEKLCDLLKTKRINIGELWLGLNAYKMYLRSIPEAKRIVAKAASTPASLSASFPSASPSLQDEASITQTYVSQSMPYTQPIYEEEENDKQNMQNVSMPVIDSQSEQGGCTHLVDFLMARFTDGAVLGEEDSSSIEDETTQPIDDDIEMEDSALAQQAVQCISSPTQQTQDMASPNLQTQTMASPTLQTQTMASPTLQTQDMASPTLQTQTMASPTQQTQTMASPTLQTQTMASPTLQTQTMASPTLQTQTMASPTQQTQTMASPTLQTQTMASPTLQTQDMATSPTQQTQMEEFEW